MTANKTLNTAISVVNAAVGKNRIINGGFDVWQRGTSSTAIGNVYLADRWISAFPTGGTISQSATAPAGSRYAWNYTASASNAFMQMAQQIEFANCYDLQGATVTISFYAKANNTNAGSTNLTVRTRTSTSVDTQIYFTGSNSDNSITLTTSYVKYTITKTLPSTFGSLSLEFVVLSSVSGDGFSISQVQLEAGSAATPFERRLFSQELALCQRYYCLVGSGSAGAWASTTSASLGVTFPVTMRASPTLSVTGSVGVLEVGIADRTGSASVFGTTIITPQGARFDISGFSGVTIGKGAVGSTNFVAAAIEL